MNLIDRIWKHINKKSDIECWEWMGVKDKNGYGRIRINKKMYSSHRIIYELICGPIPESICVCHSCDNPSCCNPNHLFLGSQSDNIKDMIIKGRWRKANNFKELNGAHKLTQQQVNKIRNLYSTSLYTYKELAIKFKMCKESIGHIIRYETWRD